MKQHVAIVLVSTLSLPLSALGSEVDVYLLGGQSNMEGCGRVSNLKEDIPDPIPNAFFFRGGSFRPLRLGETSNRPDKFGLEISFAVEMGAEGKPVYIIKYAASGQPLHYGWSGSKWRGGGPAPGSHFYPGVESDDENRGKHYKGMLRRFLTGLEALKKEGHTPVVRAFLWVQGEQDAKREESALLYAENLKHLRARLAADLGMATAEDLPMVFAQVLPLPIERFAAREIIRREMASADQDSGSPARIENCRMISTEGFSMRSDKVHFDANGQIRLGRAFAQVVKEMK